MCNHEHTRRGFIGQLGLGCASIGATSLLSSITNMGLIGAAAAANRPVYTSQSGEYKALVCIMLSGGNDSYNMLMPRGTSEYNEYAAVRTNLAIPQASLLPINPLNNTSGKEYGLHPNLTNLKNLFEGGKAAFMANIGSLIQPTNLAQYESGNNLPLGLFSHSDQVTHWQTSLPQDRNANGWGGRLADILHTNNQNNDISMNISLNGLNTFQRGNIINEYAIETSTAGSVAVNGSTSNSFYNEMKRATLDNIFESSYQNILETAYGESLSSSKNSSIAFSTALANGTPITTEFANDSLSQRLETVARTIAARDELQVTNQTFFVQMGGYDTHSNIIEEHGDLMSELDAGIHSFYTAMEELGLSDNVVTFTASDFARKLVSNGNGTDHAWGGHSFVFGGDVIGQKIYGEYPDLYLGNPLDAGNGRILPTLSCDEYFAELALWFGASSGDLDQILPNINNFWTPATGEMPLGFLPVQPA